MWLMSGRSSFNGARVQRDAAEKRKLAGVAEPIEGCPLQVRRPLGCSYGESRHFLACIAEDRLPASMSVLHIEDRVLARMLDDFGEVEIEHGIVLAIKHIETNGVTSDFVHDLAQRDELAGPLR